MPWIYYHCMHNIAEAYCRWKGLHPAYGYDQYIYYIQIAR